MYGKKTLPLTFPGPGRRRGPRQEVPAFREAEVVPVFSEEAGLLEAQPQNQLPG